MREHRRRMHDLRTTIGKLDFYFLVFILLSQRLVRAFDRLTRASDTSSSRPREPMIKAPRSVRNGPGRLVDYHCGNSNPYATTLTLAYMASSMEPYAST